MVRSIRPGYGHVAGLFPSYKMAGHAVPYESTIERDLLYFLEYDLTVLRYVARPFVITGVLADGTQHTYTPDFAVERAARTTLIECKSAALVARDHTQQQIALGTAWAAAHNQDFVLITDVDLRVGPQLENLKLLYRYCRQPVPTQALTACAALLIGEAAGRPLAAVAAAVAPGAPATAAPYLYSLLFHHHLYTDVRQPLGPASRLLWSGSAGV